MFGSGNLPSQLGDPGGGDAAGGGEQVVAFITPEVVPVRLVYSQPIPVIVTNFPGQPPPLPSGLSAPAGLPPLPKPVAPKAKEAGLGLEDLGMGGLLKLGTVAGVAAAGVGLLTKGFEELKATFIDPILGAAKGGFDRGVEKGAGTEVVGRAFEHLGMTVGLMLLPATVQLAATALAVAETFKEWKPLLEATMPALRLIAGGPQGVASKGMALAGRAIDPFGMLPAERRQKIVEFGNPFAQFAGGVAKKEPKAMDTILRLLEMSQGAKPGFVGVTDIRAQAQMAAMQDPLEAEARKEMLEMIREIRGNATLADVKKIATNTDWRAGEGHP